MVTGTVTIKINLEAEDHARLGTFVDDIVGNIHANRFIQGNSVRRAPHERFFVDVEIDVQQ